MLKQLSVVCGSLADERAPLPGDGSGRLERGDSRAAGRREEAGLVRAEWVDRGWAGGSWVLRAEAAALGLRSSSGTEIGTKWETLEVRINGTFLESLLSRSLGLVLKRRRQ